MADPCFQTSGKVSIAASKKCCWCCALLARLLTQENTHAVEFVLPGTHALIFSWSPPQGVPLVILQKMRNVLAIAFTHEAKSYEVLPSSTAKAAAVIVDNCLCTNELVFFMARFSFHFRSFAFVGLSTYCKSEGFVKPGVKVVKEQLRVKGCTSTKEALSILSR